MLAGPAGIGASAGRAIFARMFRNAQQKVEG
jgi:hypothetical protein